MSLRLRIVHVGCNDGMELEDVDIYRAMRVRRLCCRRCTEGKEATMSTLTQERASGVMTRSCTGRSFWLKWLVLQSATEPSYCSRSNPQQWLGHATPAILTRSVHVTAILHDFRSCRISSCATTSFGALKHSAVVGAHGTCPRRKRIYRT